jgi:hypothetical protein
MIRVTIEIDGKEVSSTAGQLPRTPPPELPARTAPLGAMDGGSAPGGLASVVPAFGGDAAIDAGASHEQGAFSEHAEDPKTKSKEK